MRKSQIYVGCFVAILTLILVACGGLGESFAGDCMDFLGNKTYSCSIKRDDGAVFKENCFRFSSPGEGPGDFDLRIENSEFPLTCDCKAAGSFKYPRFGKSVSFHCITKLSSSPTSILSLEGKVARKGGKIKDGNWINNSGETLVFECVEDPTCSLVPTVAFPVTEDSF